MTQFLQEIVVFLFVCNFSLQPLHRHPSTHPPIHPPSSISETRRSQRYQRVSFHESHHQRRLPGFHGNSPLQGRRSEEACVIMLRVTMETGATAYISIHCVRLLHRGTFLHIINAQSVCLLLSKITTMSFQVAGSGSSSAAAAAVKVRLISPPIKPSLCMEQLSTAISKVTHQIIFLPFQKAFQHITHSPKCSLLKTESSTEDTSRVWT